MAQYNHGYSDEQVVHIVFAKVIPTIYIVICGIMIAYYLCRAVGLYINPEYYALRDMILMVYNPCDK